MDVEVSLAGFTIDDKTEEMKEEDEKSNGSLYDVGNDVLSTILSFLSPSDIAACTCVSQRLRKLCQDDHKVWMPMCERRWGECTRVRDWGPSGRVPFKVLYSVLSRLENLVGFWRGVESGGHGSLIVFEWGPYYMAGFRIMPSCPGSYMVCKIPFVWIMVAVEGRPICLMDPEWAARILVNRDSSSSEARPSGESRPISQPLQIPVLSREEGSNAVRGKSPFPALGQDWDLEQSAPAGLVVVDVHFVGKHHIVMEEPQQPPFTGYPLSGKKFLVEAAALASFGSSENIAGFMMPEALASHGTSSGGSEAGLSPPGSFPYEMYQFLARKVTSPGSHRAARKQRRRDRDRALSQGRRPCEPEHFVKILNCSPTSTRPLQGLWKGICGSMGLDFVLLSYDEQGGIVCRKVGDSSGTARSGSIYWTARLASSIMAPLPATEQESYESRGHYQPNFGGESNLCFDEEVVSMLCTTPNVDHSGIYVNLQSVRQNIEGRVWQYASGRFGFCFLSHSHIIDFRPICKLGCLADIV